MDKLVIDVRVNEYTMRDTNPHLPCTAGEPARDAAGRTAPWFASVDVTQTLARRVIELAHACGREVVSPDEARHMPGITR